MGTWAAASILKKIFLFPASMQACSFTYRSSLSHFWLANINDICFHSSAPTVKTNRTQLDLALIKVPWMTNDYFWFIQRKIYVRLHRTVKPYKRWSVVCTCAVWKPLLLWALGIHQQICPSFPEFLKTGKPSFSWWWDTADPNHPVALIVSTCSKWIPYN